MRLMSGLEVRDQTGDNDDERRGDPATRANGLLWLLEECLRGV